LNEIFGVLLISREPQRDSVERIEVLECRFLEFSTLSTCFIPHHTTRERFDNSDKDDSIPSPPRFL
jgi:hypothetical protein